MLRAVMLIARIGIKRRLRAERSWGSGGGPWIAMSAFDGLFGFEVVLESAFLR